MFARVEVRASDLEVSRRFYGPLLSVLGRDVEPSGGTAARVAWGDFVLVQATGLAAVTRGLHVGLASSSCAAVDAFWQAGVQAGYRDDGRPGLRSQYVADYYGAFLLDPDGNSAEAVHHTGVRDDGVIDHLWIRVADLTAARAWYATREAAAGWRTRVVDETRVQVEPVAGRGTLALVSDGRRATEHAHLAVVAAGPTAASELDTDGNRVELLAPGAPVSRRPSWRR